MSLHVVYILDVDSASLCGRSFNFVSFQNMLVEKIWNSLKLPVLITFKDSTAKMQLDIVRNLIPFHTLGLKNKTEALFGKMIIDFFVAFYLYFTMVKFSWARSPLRSP